MSRNKITAARPSLGQIRQLWLGKEYPVWWETNDGRPAGNHRAKVLDVKPYTGRYDFVACIFVLAATRNYSGQCEMAIEWAALEHATGACRRNTELVQSFEVSPGRVNRGGCY